MRVTAACGVLAVVLLLSLAAATLAACEQRLAAADHTIFWAEPVDGNWWDPLRWRDSRTLLPRVPGPEDVVHVAPQLYPNNFVITLDVLPPPPYIAPSFFLVVAFLRSFAITHRTPSRRDRHWHRASRCMCSNCPWRGATGARYHRTACHSPKASRIDAFRAL
jgi:hypothetical protein